MYTTLNDFYFKYLSDDYISQFFLFIFVNNSLKRIILIIEVFFKYFNVSFEINYLEASEPK